MSLISRIFKIFKNKESESSGEETEDFGWIAIDEITNKIYPGRQLSSAITPKISPLHDLTGKQVLYQVTVFDLDDHWLYVSYGCSELFEKTWQNPNTNGLGYEFTFRLSKKEKEPPPIWPMMLMNNSAHYAMAGNTLGLGHTIKFEPSFDKAGLIQGILCIQDSELPAIETPYGSLYFLELCVVTKEIVETIRSEWPDSGTLVDIQKKSKPFITKIES